MGRTPSGNVQGLKKGAWTAEEDEKLIAYIQKHGEGSWRSLPENAGLQRCGKSCRLRWANYLRPGIKRGEFTLEEEETIIKLHAALGNRWAAIARYLPRRTDNEIKNHWNAHLKKRLAKMGIDNSAKGSPTASSSSQMRHHQGSSSASTTAKLLNKLATNLTILQRIGTNLSSQSMSVTTASTNTMSSFSGSVSAPSGPAVSDSAWVGRDMSSVFTTQLDFPEVSNSIFSESVEGNNAGDDIVSTLSNVSTPTGYAVMNRMDAKFSSLNCKEDQLQDCKTSIIQEPLMEGGTSTSKTAPIVEYVDGFSDDIDIGGLWDDCSHEADMVFPFSDEDFNFVENAILPKDDDIP